MLSKTLAFAAVLVWHLCMNAGVWMQGWYGPGFEAFIAAQVMGIPFLVDHWLKLAAVMVVWETIKHFRKTA